MNGIAQQGLVRFAVRSAAPNKEGPQDYTELKPTLTSIAPGIVRVAGWPPGTGTTASSSTKCCAAPPTGELDRSHDAHPGLGLVGTARRWPSPTGRRHRAPPRPTACG